jgi:hypothetical protein
MLLMVVFFSFAVDAGVHWVDAFHDYRIPRLSMRGRRIPLSSLRAITFVSTHIHRPYSRRYRAGCDEVPMAFRSMLPRRMGAVGGTTAPLAWY